jgi:hypothetical protein
VILIHRGYSHALKQPFKEIEMALNSKIQTFIKKLSESQNVKKVVKDIQTLSTDVQKRVRTLNSDQAVKKYKDILKKVSQAENNLEKEVNKVVVKIKKSATDVEKNLGLYRKKAMEQKTKIEKMLKTQKAAGGKAGMASKPKAKRATKRKATAKRAAARK